MLWWHSEGINLRPVYKDLYSDSQLSADKQ